MEKKIHKQSSEHRINFSYKGHGYVYTYYADALNGVITIIDTGNGQCVYSSHKQHLTIPLGSEIETELRNQKVVGNFNKEKAEIRTAVADYMRSEGCSCCQDTDAHKDHKQKLAELLDVKPYPDLSGYDFSIYRSKP